MPERRYAADREARGFAHLVASRLANVVPKLRRVDPPVAGAEAEDGTFAVDEHERLDDLPDVRADCVSSFLCCPGRVGKLLDLHIEAELVQPILQSLSRRMHAL